MSTNIYELGAVVSLRDLATSQLKDIGERWEKFREGIKGTSKEIDRFESGMKSMKVGGVMLGAGVALKSALAPAVDEARRFEKELALLGATSNASANDMKKFQDAAIATGLKTMFSPQEAAAGLTALASAGVEGADAITNSLAPALDLAAASAGKLGIDQAAADMAATMMSFKAQGVTAKGVVDTFVNMANVASFSIQDLGPAWRGVNLAASAANQSLSTTGAVMAALKNSGATAIESGEGVRMALSALKAPSTVAQKEMAKLGFSAYDQNGKMKDLIVAFEELNEKTKNMSDADRNLVLDKILLEGGMKAFNATTVQGIDKVKQWKSTLETSGTGASFAGRQIDTFEGSVKMLEGSWQTFKVLIGGAVVPILRVLFDGLNSLMGPILGMMQASPIFMKITGVVLTAATGLFLFGGAIKMVSGAYSILTAMQKVGVITIVGYDRAMKIATVTKSLFTLATWKDIAATTLATTRTIGLTAMEAVNRQGRYLGIQAAFTGAAAENAMGITRVWLTAKTGLLTAASWALNSAMYANPVGLIIIGVVALIGAVAAAIYYFDTWSGWVKQVWNDHKFLIGVVLALSGPLGWMIGGIALLADNWSKVSGAIETAVVWMKRFMGASESEIQNDKLSSKLKSNKSKLAEMEGSGLKAGDKSYDTLAGQIRADEELQKAYQGNVNMAKEKNDTLKKLDEDRAKAIKAQSGAVKGSDEYKDYQKRIDSLNSNKSVLELGGMDALKKYQEPVEKKVEGIKQIDSATQKLNNTQSQTMKMPSIMEQNIGTDWVNGMQAPANLETPQQMMQSMNAEQVVQKITSEKSSPARVVTNNNSIMGSMNNTGGGGFSGGANITLNLQSLVQNLQIDKFNEAELEKVFGPLLAKALMKEVEKNGIVEAA